MKHPVRHIALLTIVTGLTATPAMGGAGSRLIMAPETSKAIRLVAAHNQLRAEAGAQPLYWDAALAQAADSYAAELARSGRLVHAPAVARPGQGENLWMGTRGAFSVDTMVAHWGTEKLMFRAGQFPHVSTTGRWEDVGHYTQIIWPTSIRIGCAVRSSGTDDFLVCRYGQSGNVAGQRVGATQLASR